MNLSDTVIRLRALIRLKVMDNSNSQEMFSNENGTSDGNQTQGIFYFYHVHVVYLHKFAFNS